MNGPATATRSARCVRGVGLGAESSRRFGRRAPARAGNGADEALQIGLTRLLTHAAPEVAPRGEIVPQLSVVLGEAGAAIAGQDWQVASDPDPHLLPRKRQQPQRRHVAGAGIDEVVRKLRANQREPTAPPAIGQLLDGAREGRQQRGGPVGLAQHLQVVDDDDEARGGQVAQQALPPSRTIKILAGARGDADRTWSAPRPPSPRGAE